MGLVDTLKFQFRNGDAVVRLIFINVSVFAVLQSINIFLMLFNLQHSVQFHWLSAPASISKLMVMPWSPLTYQFLHQGLFHLLFNMLALFWFGRLFLLSFSQKQLASLYLIGGFAGYVLYAVAYNVFPYFSNIMHEAMLLGASGSIMAIILAAATEQPSMQIRMLFVGAVKLKYVALFVVLTSFLGINSDNAGGEIAHLGGALAGYIFVVSLRKGWDISAGINRIFDVWSRIFKPRRLKVKRVPNKKQKMTDAEFNQTKATNMQEIDRILDKVKASGYQSLSADEKKRLFNQGNTN